MRIILVNGSPRPNGNTAAVIELCRVTIEAQGVETKIIELGVKKIESCIACNKCIKNHGYCALDDGVNEIIEDVRNAEGMIVAAPVYFGTARGDVMNLLQRLGKVSIGCGNFLNNMAGGPIAVARRGGHTATIQEMLMFYLINGMIVCGANYWNIVFALNPGEVEEDVEGMKNIEVFATNVANVVKKLNS